MCRCECYPPQRALAALRAISARFRPLSTPALASPPLDAPSFPRADMLASLVSSGWGGASPVAMAPMAWASWFTSRGMGRLCMGQAWHRQGVVSSGERARSPLKFKVTHYPIDIRRSRIANLLPSTQVVSSIMNNDIVASIDAMLRNRASADDALIQLGKEHEANISKVDAMRKAVAAADEFLSQPHIEAIVRRDARVAIERIVTGVVGGAYSNELKKADVEAMEHVEYVASKAVLVIEALIK